MAGSSRHPHRPALDAHIWPFDAKAAGIGTIMRDGGTMVMFAGTPYAHLHICGSPWDGNEYQPGDRGAWTMTYSRS
jgi:hypothetical protein